MSLRITRTLPLRLLIASLFAAACFAATVQPADGPSGDASSGQQPSAKNPPTESELLQATEDTPNNAEAWLAYAGFQTQHREWQKAIEPLQRAIALGKHDGMTFLSLGIAYQYTQDQNRALEYYTKALEHGCDEALLYRGRLHALMGKSDLAIGDFDNAIEHKVNLAESYLDRGCTYRMLRDVNRALADFSSAIKADPKSATAYEWRARLRNDVIGDFHGAVDDFTRATELDPNRWSAYGGRGTAHLKHGDYDQGLADIDVAIQLNPGDLGQTFQPSTDKALDPAALAHGEEQLQKMLADRPRMAEHVEKGDRLWNWAVRKFAGEDLGSPIFWDPTSPDPFGSRSRSRSAGEPAGIQLNLLDEEHPNQPKRQQQGFDQLWACAVFELYNVTSSSEWQRLRAEANAGKISRDDFIQAMMHSEFTSTQRTRAFYFEFFLPWIRSKNLKDTDPSNWFCDVFPDADHIRADYAFRGKSLYLSFYENSYDIHVAYREELRGSFNGAKEILTRVLDHPDGLADSQIAYAQNLLALAKQSSGDPSGAIQDLTHELNENTHLVDNDAKRAESLYARAVGYNLVHRTDEELADLNAAIELNPKATEPLVARANLFIRIGKYDDATQNINTLLAADPASYDVFYLRGCVEFYNRNYALAVEELNKGFDPINEQALYMRGSCYVMLKEYDKALPDIDAYVHFRPTDANAYASRGTVYQYLQQYPKALADFDRATELDPKLPAPYVNRALLFATADDPTLRRPEQAIQDARRGCELADWKEPEALRALASAYAATGDFASAIKWQEKAIKIGDADHREEYSQLLAGYRQHVTTPPLESSIQSKVCSERGAQSCSERCQPCRRRPIVRLFRR